MEPPPGVPVVGVEGDDPPAVDPDEVEVEPLLLEVEPEPVVVLVAAPP
jgi:hypothetical protein